MLVQIIKDWNYPDIFRQTPKNKGEWNGIRFTTEEVNKCDAVIVLNKVPRRLNVTCPVANIWAVMQEPYIPGIFKWMVEGHDQFHKIFTHHIFSENKEYIPYFPMLPWHVNKSYDELIQMKVPKKNKTISWITSNKTLFPGHKQRIEFLEFINQSDLKIDIFGKGIAFIEDKWDGLAPYKYSLAIENSSSTNYWTEKISDCFLSYTLPIYYGCENLEDYFPKDSFIRIDITNPKQAVKIIQDALEHDEWEKRLGAIKEAREMVLNKYNFFAQIERLLEAYKYDEQEAKTLTLKPYVHKQSIREKVMSIIGKFKV